MAEPKRRLGKKDYERLGDTIKAEYQRRADDKKRQDKEKAWEEIDRQVAMKPKASENKEEEDAEHAWMSSLELPDQASALADSISEARRLAFTPDESWYRPHVAFTDQLGERIKNFPLHHGDESGLTPGMVAQDTANLIVKALLDHFHGLYGFRRMWDKMWAEAFKYGTYVGRARLVTDLSAVSSEFRAMKGTVKLPMMIPLSVKNVYLDDRPQWTAMEGMSVRPADIRKYWQYIPDIERAAKKSGSDAGWVMDAVKTLEPNKEKRNHAELIEFEGDLFVPRSQGENIFLGSQICTLDLKSGNIIRMRESTLPFRSYISGVYQEESADSPYGSSPLMLGRSLQELASEAANRTADSAILNTEPPTLWDTGDTRLQATKGPVIAPGAHNESDNPESVNVLQVGDPTALFAVLAGARNMYQELNKRQEPRASGEMKSHTTAFATDASLSRGVLPMEDFIDEAKRGPMTSWLHMEFVLAREALTRTHTVFVAERGENVHIDIAREIWPERCDFEVLGALGAFTEREKRDSFFQSVQALAQIEQLAVSQGGKPTDWDAVRLELLRLGGRSDAERFFRSPEAVSPGDEGEQAVPGDIAEFAGGGTEAA